MAEPQKTSAAVAEAETIDLDEFSELLEKDFRVKKDDSEKLQQLVRNLALAAQTRAETTPISSNAISDRRHR
jgi:type VI secretion system protein ImpC